MTIMCCDRCGRDITKKPKFKLIVKWTGIKGNGTCHAVPQENDRYSEKDFCINCYEAFKDFTDCADLVG